MAELVVAGALFRVTQDLVGACGELEFFFGRFVVGVFVGMKLHGKLAISFFDRVAVGVLGDTENFVKILFLHGLGQYGAGARSGQGARFQS